MALPEPKNIDPVRAEVTPGLKDSPQRWWLLALLFTAMLISYAHRSALSVAAPFISKDLNLSKTEMGILLSSFFWVYAFMQMPAGWIVDRFGVRRAYSLGFIFWSLASAATGFGVGVVSLLGFRIATGAGQAITFPASSRACANWFPESEWQPLPPRYERGFGALYAAHVTQADQGCDFDFLHAGGKTKEPEIH